MGKIEEITELLTNELNAFKEDVERLEKLNVKLQVTKLKVDVKELRSLLLEHEREMKYNLDSQERIYKRFEGLLKNAKIYPTWALVVFIISLVFVILSISYILLR